MSDYGCVSYTVGVCVYVHMDLTVCLHCITKVDITLKECEGHYTSGAMTHTHTHTHPVQMDTPPLLPFLLCSMTHPTQGQREGGEGWESVRSDTTVGRLHLVYRFTEMICHHSPAGRFFQCYTETTKVFPLITSKPTLLFSVSQVEFPTSLSYGV